MNMPDEKLGKTVELIFKLISCTLYVYLSSWNLHPQRIIKFDPYLLFIEIKQWNYIPMNLWKTDFPPKIVPCVPQCTCNKKLQDY